MRIKVLVLKREVQSYKYEELKQSLFAASDEKAVKVGWESMDGG